MFLVRCKLTPYSLSITHWAGSALAPACVGCAFRLAPAVGGRAWPFVRMAELRSLGCKCKRQCSCPSQFVGVCHIGITVQLCGGRSGYGSNGAWACGGWAVWLLLNGCGGWVGGVAYYLSRCGWPTSNLTFHTHTSLHRSSTFTFHIHV